MASHKFLLLFLSLPFWLGAQGRRFYVNAAAAPGGSGLSWATAFADLQDALLAAAAGDSVWVAQGIYKPTTTANRDRSFEPKSGLRLFGGFAGTETHIGERNYAAHPTVLSGDIGAVGDSTDNSYNVVYLHFPDTNTIIDGFIIRNGTANSAASVSPVYDRRKCGGGLYIMGADWEAYGEIRNCVFLFNYARNYGGGVLVNGAGDGSVAPRFVNCHFDRNRCFALGGGMARMGSSFVERGVDFEGCKFTGNIAGSWGGGLLFQDAERLDSIEVVNCRFEGNQAGLGGGAARFLTGRVIANGLIIKGCFFTLNQTSGSVNQANLLITDLNEGYVKQVLLDRDTFATNTKGNAVYVSQFGTKLSLHVNRCNFTNNLNFSQMAYFEAIDSAMFFIKNTFFKGNFANQGIGLTFSLFIKAQLDQCFFANNTVSLMYVIPANKDVQFINCDINSNTMSNNINQGQSPFGNLNFTNCNIIDTKLRRLFRNFKSANITNSLFTGIPDLADGLETLPTNTTLDYCRFDSLNCAALPPGVSCGTHNLIGVLPMFRDSAGGDFRLLPCSPLVGAGLNSATAGILTDVDGRPRIAGDRVDIGPYETPAFAWAAAPLLKPACRDANDGSVEFSSDYGCPPVAVQWTRQDGGSGSGSDQLAPGAYFFELTDARGQRLRDTLDILPNPGPTLAATATPVQCGSDAGGSAAVNATGGIPPVALRWSNGQTAAQLAQLPPGDYTVTATDAAGCRDSAALSVARLGALTLLVGGNVISCFGQRDGRASVTPLGGKQPFRFQWDDGAADSLRTQLPPGLYAVTVADAFGCTADYQFKLSQPDSLRLSGVAQEASGPAVPNGSAVIGGIQGGTAPFRYLWSTGATTDGLFNLLPGLYTVTVRDFNGCTAVQTLAVRYTSSTGEAPGRVLLVFYPNPAAGATNVQAVLPPGASGLQLMLYDNAGRLLQQLALPDTDAQGELTAPVPLGDLPAGLYRAVLVDAQGVVRGQGAVVKEK